VLAPGEWIGNKTQLIDQLSTDAGHYSFIK